MTDPAARALADQLTQLTPDPATNVRGFWATVTGITSSPNGVIIKISSSGATIYGVRYDSKYTPTVNDTVYGRIVGTDFLVEGKLA